MIRNFIVATFTGGINCRNWDDVKIQTAMLKMKSEPFTVYYKDRHDNWVEHHRYTEETPDVFIPVPEENYLIKQ